MTQLCILPSSFCSRVQFLTQIATTRISFGGKLRNAHTSHSSLIGWAASITY
jgi:hypothetical protein